MDSKRFLITNVLQNSIAEEVGIEAGDFIVSINGENISDVFDYRFLITQDSLLIEIEKPDGELWEIEVEKDEYEDIGLEFESSMMDDAKSCTNKCIFCFIDQLPEGMRDTLYFKDDDSRLSFLNGNYITLTNINDENLDRIIRYRMSPVNVSVHTTNTALRVSMLKNKFAGNVMEKIKRLIDGGITVNCQIVLCRGINDGYELDKSIIELSELYPGLGSISIVPVGITKFREGLCTLSPFSQESAKVIIDQVENWQQKLLDIKGSRVVYLADEFYTMADIELPAYDAYEDFPQIENGIGLISLLKYEFDEYLGMKVLDKKKQKLLKSEYKRQVSIATGESAYKYIKEMAQILQIDYNIAIEVYKIKNNFFGETVTVVGLITGKDLVEQLKDKKIGTTLFISNCMLKAEEQVFLDDYTIQMVENELNIKVVAVENSGKDFIDKLLGNM